MLRDTLGSLPATLNGQYAQILGNIHTNHRKLAVKAFQWVIHSKVPIYVDELVDVLAIDVAAKPRFSPKRRLIDQEDLFRICSNLIDVSPRLRLGEKREQDSVRFAHLSVKEFLLSNQLLATPFGDFAPSHSNTHAIIARDCLSYLLHVNDSYGVEAKNLAILSYVERESFMGLDVTQEFHTKPPYKLDDLRKWRVEGIGHEEELRAALPLVFYAAEYWTYHARIAGEQSKTVIFFNLWSKPSNLVLSRPGAILCIWDGTADQLVRLVEHLLRQTVDVNAYRSEGYTPLQMAAHVDNLEIIEMLIDFGAKVEVYSDDRIAGSPLFVAAHTGLVEVVVFLLDKGADVDNNWTKNLRTPLMAAAKMNHLDIVRILISKGGDVNAVRTGEYTALKFASSGGYTEMGHTETVRLLLEAGFDVNATVTAVHEEDLQDGHGWGQTALQHAAEYGRLPVMKLLINWGADVNIQADGEWRTALQLACWLGHPEMVQLLIDFGADVHVRGGKYETALQAACAGCAVDLDRKLSDTDWKNHTLNMQLRLQRLANMGEPGGQLGTSRHLATQKARIRALKLLLKKGADPNQRGGQWGSALQAALEHGFGQAAHQLLLTGAERDVKPEYRSGLEDVDRGINLLFWRDQRRLVRNEDGTRVPIAYKDLPDGIYKLPEEYYFDKTFVGYSCQKLQHLEKLCAGGIVPLTVRSLTIEVMAAIYLKSIINCTRKVLGLTAGYIIRRAVLLVQKHSSYTQETGLRGKISDGMF
ncbi:MAG: hypothetical protein Q9204_007730 [Flavoplaca sp. TL-2023a]